MNKWVIIIGLWMAVIVGFVIYSHSYKGDTIDNSPPPVPKIDEMRGGGPEVGDSIDNQESPQQLVSRFLQYVNSGNYELASGLINANVLLTYTSSRKDMTPHNALVAYVRLFPQGHAKNMQVSKGEEQGGTASVSARISLTSGKRIDAAFQLTEFIEEGHGGIDRYWIIVGYSFK